MADYLLKDKVLKNGLSEKIRVCSSGVSAYNGDVSRKFEVTFGETDNDDEPNLFDDEHISMDLNTVTRIGRIGALQLEFASNRLFAEYFLYLLLAISVVIIVIITKKRIEDESNYNREEWYLC